MSNFSVKLFEIRPVVQEMSSKDVFLFTALAAILLDRAKSFVHFW